MWDSLVNQHIPSEMIVKKNDSELACITRTVPSNDSWIRGYLINLGEWLQSMWCLMNTRKWRKQSGLPFPAHPERKPGYRYVLSLRQRQDHAWKLLQTIRQPGMVPRYSERWRYEGIFSRRIEWIRKNTPQALYQPEYECSFIDNALILQTDPREYLF